MWSIGEEARRAIAQSLQDGFAVLMRQLKLAKTADIVARFVHPPQLSYDRESEIVAAGGRIMWLRRRRNDWQTEVEEAGVPAKRTRVVIVGAGFGGLHAALQLEQLSSRNNGPEITLVNDENVFLFTPGRRDEESVCALYGWLLRSPAVRGASWGVILWLLAQTMVMPMAGEGFLSTAMGDMMAVVGSLVGHLLYGALLGVIAGDVARAQATSAHV